jgi:hypothetical protein
LILARRIDQGLKSSVSFLLVVISMAVLVRAIITVLLLYVTSALERKATFRRHTDEALLEVQGALFKLRNRVKESLPSSGSCQGFIHDIEDAIKSLSSVTSLPAMALEEHLGVKVLQQFAPLEVAAPAPAAPAAAVNWPQHCTIVDALNYCMSQQHIDPSYRNAFTASKSNCFHLLTAAKQCRVSSVDLVHSFTAATDFDVYRMKQYALISQCFRCIKDAVPNLLPTMVPFACANEKEDSMQLGCEKRCARKVHKEYGGTILSDLCVAGKERLCNEEGGSLKGREGAVCKCLHHCLHQIAEDHGIELVADASITCSNDLGGYSTAEEQILVTNYDVCCFDDKDLQQKYQLVKPSDLRMLYHTHNLTDSRRTTFDVFGYVRKTQCLERRSSVYDYVCSTAKIAFKAPVCEKRQTSAPTAEPTAVPTLYRSAAAGLMGGESKADWLFRAEEALKRHNGDASYSRRAALQKQFDLVKTAQFFHTSNVTAQLPMKTRQELDDVLGSLDPTLMHAAGASSTTTPTSQPTPAPTDTPTAIPTTLVPTPTPTSTPTVSEWDRQAAPISDLDRDSIVLNSDMENFTKWTRSVLGSTWSLGPFTAMPTPTPPEVVSYGNALQQLERRFQDSEFKHLRKAQVYAKRLSGAEKEKILGITQLKQAFASLNSCYARILPWAKKIAAVAKRARRTVDSTVTASSKQCGSTDHQRSSQAIEALRVESDRKLSKIGATLQVLQKQYQRVSSATEAFKTRADTQDAVPDPFGVHQLYFDLQEAERAQKRAVQIVSELFESNYHDAALLEEQSDSGRPGFVAIAVLGWCSGVAAGVMALGTGTGTTGGVVTNVT